MIDIWNWIDDKNTRWFEKLAFSVGNIDHLARVEINSPLVHIGIPL